MTPVCKVSKHWVCFCFQKMALKISLQQENIFQSIKFQLKKKKGNRNGKPIGPLTKTLMECYKMYTSPQSCPEMRMTGALLPSALEAQRAMSPTSCLASASGPLTILGTAYQQEKSLSSRKEKQKA